MSNILDLSARTLTAHLRSGELSSVELISATYDRIEALNPTYNAIVSLRPRREVLAEAALADGARASGATAALHGLPIAVKDLSMTRGLRTTFGSPIFRDFVPETDSLMVARLRAAGAIIIGKTNTPEFGLGSHTYNPVFGPTRNALNPSLSAGGSSGGAAVAVATGMLPLADGSDYGGSLRNPAAWNGIFGFRPSQGRVPTVPAADPFFGQLGTDGPMARNVRDLALLLDVQAGYDPSAPLSLPDEAPILPRLDIPAASRRYRIGWLGDLSGHLTFEPGILEACEATLDRLSAQGCEVTHLAPDVDFEALWQAFVILRQFNLSARLETLYRDPAKRALLKPEACWEVEGFLAQSGQDLLRASMTRGAWYEKVAALFTQFDVLALPSAQVHPFAVEMHWTKSIAGYEMDSYHRWMEVVAPGTLSSCPVLNAPAGLSHGMPVGMQFIGKPRDDAGLLKFGLDHLE